MEAAFMYSQQCSNNLLSGQNWHETLWHEKLVANSKPPSEGAGVQGAASLRFIMEVVLSIRRFMKEDMLATLRDHAETSLEPCDATSLNVLLPFLRESFRIIGYSDISPQSKLWSIYHCEQVAKNVMTILDVFENTRDLRSMPMIASLKAELANRKKTQPQFVDPAEDRGVFLEADSYWLFSKRDLMQTSTSYDRMIRKLHSRCPVLNSAAGLYSPMFEVLNSKDMPVKLEFEKPPPANPYSIFLKDEDMNAGHPAMTNAIGWFVPGINSQDPGTVLVKSRLFQVTIGLLKKTGAGTEEPQSLTQAFSMSDWLGEQLRSSAVTVEEKNQQKNQQESDPKTATARKSHAGHSNTNPLAVSRHVTGGTNILLAEEGCQYISLNAVVKDSAGREVNTLTLSIGTPLVCYPISTRLCLDSNPIFWPGTGPTVSICALTDLGVYRIRPSMELSAENDRDFEPNNGNHVYTASPQYETKQRIIYSQERGSWSDATVLEGPSESTGWRYRLLVEAGKSGKNGAQLFGSAESSAALPGNESMLRHLTMTNSGNCGNMHSGTYGISAAMYEDEGQKFKISFRTRHSFIIDTLSGKKVDVKECALPALTMKGVGMEATKSSTDRVSRSPRPIGKSLSVSSSTSGASGMSEGDRANGWNTITSAVELYEKGIPTCTPNAFLVLGMPGSGKSCLLCRLIMDCSERHIDLMPLLMPIADLVKRTDVESEALCLEGGGKAEIRAWWDKYMRLTYGEDSQRYRMMMQAMRMRRLVFLFEGLEDSGALMPMVERLIEDFVTERHLVVITSRPLLASSSSILEDIPDRITVFELQSLTREQMKSVAASRLGVDGLKSFESFFSKLRQSQGSISAKQDGEEDDDGGEDVFGNPMMLSMLICYLQMRQEKEKKKDGSATDPTSEDNVTLTAVYRVATDVMLQRVQSRQQADRLNKEGKVQQCKKILEVMAMRMQTKESLKIEESEIDELLVGKGDELKDTWKALRVAVVAGHAVFLRVSNEGNKMTFRFLVKGFQNFFAASNVESDPKCVLPPLTTLMENTWWSQMLEMVAEEWPHRYVKVIEDGVKTHTSKNNDTFLHLMAAYGHRHVFLHLKNFSEANQACLHSLNNDGMRPLHVAAEKGHINICALMLENSAAIDAVDNKDRLPLHVSLQAGHFFCAKFLLDRFSERRTPSKRYSNQARRPKDNPLEKLAQRVQGSGGMPQITEEEFKAAITDTFVELQYFRSGEEKKKTIGSLLSVYWIVGDKYEQFVRGQPVETRLTKNSWDSMQGIWGDRMKVTINQASVSAILTLVAIGLIGKIADFKKAFAPDFEDHVGSLAHILQKHPILVPSFMKLDEQYQSLCLSALHSDFNTGQFLQAENLPAALVPVKEVLNTSKTDGKGTTPRSGVASDPDAVLGFLLFRIFSMQCGLRAPKGMEGSLFMNEVMYKNFKVGLDVLQNLTHQSVHEVYNAFLAQRAQAQGITWNGTDRESRALVRLACLARTFKDKEAKPVVEAFNALTPQERAKLSQYLGADGIKEKGFLLYYCPELLECARFNPNVELIDAMRLMLQIFEKADSSYKTTSNEIMTVSIMMSEVREYANACTDVEKFRFTKFSIVKTPGSKSESQGAVHLSPWQLLNDAEKLDQLMEQASLLVSEVQSKTIREVTFQRRLPACFPELRFFSDNRSDSNFLNQTRSAALVLYWLASNQSERFNGGHGAEHKLSESEWNWLMRWEDDFFADEERLDALFVAVVIANLGCVASFSEQLAPNATSHQEAIGLVLKEYPKVLQSYTRLSPVQKLFVHGCVTTEFAFEEAMMLETTALSMKVVRELYQQSKKTEVGGEAMLQMFLIFHFCLLSGRLGGESVEGGSLYMTAARFRFFQIAANGMLSIAQGKTEQQVVDAIIEEHAVVLGLSFDQKKPESRAAVRLAALTKVDNTEAALQVSYAFKSLDDRERKELARFLNADGMTEKPSFLLRGSADFLEAARSNEAVGLGAAVRILLKVYESAAKEFQGSTRNVVAINLDGLAVFTKEFFGSVQFQDLPFELQKVSESLAIVRPKVWIPVSSPEALKSLEDQGRELATQVIKKKISEDAFRTRTGRIYPELAYFPPNMAAQRSQTTCAMLSVFWLVSNQYEAFTSSQAPEEKLTRQSWAWIQEWMMQNVHVNREAVCDAILVFIAIQFLGKITEFREELAPGEARMYQAGLAQILKTKPQVVPSFMRLDDHYKRLIIDSLGVEFQFSEFLNAESTPAALVVMKERLQHHGDDGFAFFCFRFFAQICGKTGNSTMKGSAFMNERMFQRFRPGLDALQQLMKLDAVEAYNAFLLTRGSQSLSRFASPEHQALSRLLCLGSAFDVEDGRAVCEAFDELTPEERQCLTRWLNADGIHDFPGCLLLECNTLLEAAKLNPCVGLTAALRMLLRVEAEADIVRCRCKVVIKLGEIAAWAEEVSEQTGDFHAATLQVTSEMQNDDCVVSVEVIRPAAGASPTTSFRGGSRNMNSCQFGLAVTSILALVVGAAALAATLIAAPQLIRAIMPDSLNTEIMPRRAHVAIVSGIVAVLLLIYLACCCRWRAASSRFSMRRRPSGRGVCCAAALEPMLMSRGGYSRLRQEDEADVERGMP
eukprot:TRINITY_DN25017_c0_g1_i2.p1 TRINITY_DN25017_c0_g1~~TRINITY_DN25017_c0_g1_i2.p1  ORF type:complete len:2736 (-),score=602.94 TRINITY_DN25017_c0_g1_i2:74-7891(-)